jgi:phosphoribosylaminoimidazole-succinocarboxamide synthase
MNAIPTNPYRKEIITQLPYCLEHSTLPALNAQRGKVRDLYSCDEKLILVSTDRQSAFDRMLGCIPFKGQVLNQCSVWWLQESQTIVENHFIDSPDPNVIIAKKCTMFPIEIIVRGYMTGSTHTSLWQQYKSGVRNYCGHQLDEGFIKNQKLAHPIVTPTTKTTQGDHPISPDGMIRQGYITANEWDDIQNKALELFAYGQTIAANRGLILVDTKYEFGKDDRGHILLADEVHTPDSSRYWLADSYSKRMAEGKQPDHIDKEFLRLWFVEHCDPYHDKHLPAAPEDLIVELSYRYIYLYERMTQKKFCFPTKKENINERIAHALASYGRVTC